MKKWGIFIHFQLAQSFIYKGLPQGSEPPTIPAYVLRSGCPSNCNLTDRKSVV